MALTFLHAKKMCNVHFGLAGLDSLLVLLLLHYQQPFYLYTCLPTCLPAYLPTYFMPRESQVKKKVMCMSDKGKKKVFTRSMRVLIFCSFLRPLRFHCLFTGFFLYVWMKGKIQVCEYVL